MKDLQFHFFSKIHSLTAWAFGHGKKDSAFRWILGARQINYILKFQNNTGKTATEGPQQKICRIVLCTLSR